MRLQASSPRADLTAALAWVNGISANGFPVDPTSFPRPFSPTHLHAKEWKSYLPAFSASLKASLCFEAELGE